jgi:thioredoxin 2
MRTRKMKTGRIMTGAAPSRIVTCAGCGAKNRVHDDRLTDQPRCGRCDATLSLDEARREPLIVDDESFEALVLGARGYLLLDCWAAWCQPCRMTHPTIKKLAAAHDAHLTVAKLDTADNRYTASTLQLTGIPSFLLYKDGVELDRLAGGIKRERFEEWLRGHGVIPSTS